MKWLALVLTVLLGVSFAYLSWREAQKPPPAGDLPPCHFVALFLVFAVWTIWAWTRKPTGTRRMQKTTPPPDAEDSEKLARIGDWIHGSVVTFVVACVCASVLGLAATFLPSHPDPKELPIVLAVVVWSLSITLGTCTAVWNTRRHRRGRQKGRCRTCGYDLTGNTSGVCPECGQAIGAGNPPHGV